MSTIRQQIADQIKADNAAFVVDTYPRSYPENLRAGGTYVQVYREAIRHTSEDALTVDLKAVVLVAKQDGPKAEDDLEGALDQVLLSVERFPGASWSEATRVVLGDKWNAYEVSVTVGINNAYRTLALNS